MLVSANRSQVDPTRAESALRIALERLISVEPDVTKYDTIVGDGDCGIGLKRGAECELSITWSAAWTDTTQRSSRCSKQQRAQTMS